MNFKYCECGCKGSSAKIGSLHFWLYNDLQGNYFLHQGHGWMAPLIRKFKSFEAGVNCTKRLALKEANLIRKNLT